MSFSYSAGVITQANEAGKSITAVADGGSNELDLTISAHGYSAGDLIAVTGTTSYNGAYLISSIIDANTVAIPDTTIRGDQNAFGSTETGTAARGDSDLSGLVGLTGVSTDSGGSGRTVYTLSAVRIVCTGAMLYNAYSEQIRFTNPASTTTQFTCGENAYLTVQSFNTSYADQANQQSRFVAMEFNEIDSNFGSTTINALTQSASSADSFFSGTYVVNSTVVANDAGSPYLFSGGNVTFQDAILLTALQANIQLRFNGTTVVSSLRRVKLIGTSLNYTTGGSPEVFDDVEFIDNNETIVIFSSASNTYVPLDGLAADNAGVVVRTNDSAAGRAIHTRLTNFQNGFGGFSWSTNTNPGAGDQRCALWKEHRLIPEDEIGASVTAKYYAIDTDSGNRSTNYTEEVTGYNYTVATSSTYAGESSDVTVEDIIAFGNPDGSTDNRGEDANAGKTFTFSSYNNDNTTLLTTTDGLGMTIYRPILVTDILVTELSKAVVDAYLTLDDGFQSYDAFKSEYIDQFGAGVLAKWFGRSGNQLASLDNNSLIIDATAVSVRSFAAGVGTVKSSLFTGGFNSNGGTGDVTVRNGALLNGGTFDCDINYEGGAGTTLTNVTCTGTLDFDTAGTYTLDGCTINEVTNSSGGDVTLNTVNSTVTTNTGPDITINNSVTISANVTDINGNPLQNTRVYIKTTSGGPEPVDTEILNDVTDVNGDVSTTYNFTSNQPITGWSRLSSSSPYYRESPISGTITSDGFTTNPVMILDE